MFKLTLLHSATSLTRNSLEGNWLENLFDDWSRGLSLDYKEVNQAINPKGWILIEHVCCAALKLLFDLAKPQQVPLDTKRQ